MSSPEHPAPASSNRKVIGAIIALVLIVIFGFTYASVLNSYHKEGEKQTATIRDKAAPAADHVEVIATAISADPVKKEMVVRIDLVPHGALTVDEGASPTEDLTLLVNSSTGKREHIFQKGKLITPVDVIVDLVGQASDYPFDEHQGQLFLGVTTPVKKEQTPSSPASPEDEEPAKEKKGESSLAESEGVPLIIDFAGSLQGLKMEATKNQRESGEFFSTIDVSITRASTIKLFAVFIMIMFWSLSLAALVISLFFWLGKRVDLNTLPFHVGLLFAFPAVRDSQPGAPPLGTYSDYLAFFWAEGIVAISLLVFITVLVLRRPAK